MAAGKAQTLGQLWVVCHVPNLGGAWWGDGQDLGDRQTSEGTLSPRVPCCVLGTFRSDAWGFGGLTEVNLNTGILLTH